MIAVLIIAALILILLLWWIKTSNSFKRGANKIKEASSGIEVALTNRYDMLTKLRDVAKNYAAYEKGVFTEVISLRRGMSLAEMNEASTKMDRLSSDIQLTAEAYPELRSSDNFRELQNGIRDAEAHLQAARRLYNSQVTSYNNALDVFPSSLVGSSMKLEKQELFVAESAKKNDVSMQF